MIKITSILLAFVVFATFAAAEEEHGSFIYNDDSEGPSYCAHKDPEAGFIFNDLDCRPRTQKTEEERAEASEEEAKEEFMNIDWSEVRSPDGRPFEMISEDEPENEADIVGGRRCDIKGVPYQVALFIAPRKGRGWFFCSGSLTNRRTVLTAAHCLVNARKVLIVAGVTCLKKHPTKDAQFRLVFAIGKQIRPHKEYNEHTLEDDIGMVKFIHPIEENSSVKTVKRAKPETRWSLSGRDTIVAGWGLVDSGVPKLANCLRCVGIKLIANCECQQMWSPFLTTDRGRICTSGAKGKGPCLGDSGAPVVIPCSRADGDSCEVKQVGIVSAGSPQCDNGLPGINTYSPDYENWISEWN